MLTFSFVLGIVIIAYAVFKQKAKCINETEVVGDIQIISKFMGMERLIFDSYEPSFKLSKIGSSLCLLLGFIKAVNMKVLFYIMMFVVNSSYLYKMLEYISRDGRQGITSPTSTYLSMVLLHGCTVGLFMAVVLFLIAVIYTKRTSIELSVADYAKIFGWIYGLVMLNFYEMLFVASAVRSGTSTCVAATVIVFTMGFFMAILDSYNGGQFIADILKALRSLLFNKLIMNDTQQQPKMDFKKMIVGLYNYSFGINSVVHKNTDTASISQNLICSVKVEHIPSWMSQILRFIWMFLTPISTFLNYARYSLLPSVLQDEIIRNSGTVYGTRYPNKTSIRYAFFRSLVLQFS